MDKRYQVFISSTFQDLIEERNEVVQALLELDCIPCGMEYFPASNETQWEFIKKLIDDCDYYTVIIGGKYGSVDDNGTSYTEKEYDYAISKDIPIIGFIHENPQDLPLSKSEEDQDKKIKLENFKQKVRKKLCKFWTSPKDLGGVVSRSMIQEIKRNPRIGWIKADTVDTNAEKKILDLYKKIEDLENRPSKIDNAIDDILKLVDSTTDLCQGQDTFPLKIMLTFGVRSRTQRIESIDVSWDDITFLLLPKMIDSTKETLFKSLLNRVLKEFILEKTSYKESPNIVISISDESFETIKIQLLALGYLATSMESDENQKDKLVRKIILANLGKQKLLIQRALKK